ncbi:protein KRBA1-like [Alligator sinensis]|uniref:Protein KRBA1-like n=1 Tax=Alligator sinensis TaxID=38654 RepID=A0A3Q0HKZ6_ALLSI|nr:protein KRBA1-like [Alligator sinensis]
MAESSPLQSLENCLRDLAAAERPSHPGTPESSPCNGSSRQEQVQRSLELRAGRCPSKVQSAAGTPDTMSDQPGDRRGRPSSSSSVEGEREQRGLPEPQAPPRCQEAVPAEESPLQGLLNCLKEILVRAPRCPPSLPSGAAGGRAPGESLPSLQVKTEAASGAPHGPGSHRAPASCSISTGRAAGERCPQTLGRSCRGEGTGLRVRLVPRCSED